MSRPVATPDGTLAGPALRAFTQIAEAWSLTEQEQWAILGQPVDAAFAVIGAGDVDDLWPDTLKRVSYVLGIYRALHTIFSDPEQANSWVRRPNAAPTLNGSTALALISSGMFSDLESVRQHLEAGGWVDPEAPAT